ncbi:MAG: dTMP kinase [Bacteroidia bacterium]|nr:dTMP kinase [Bacteroidia bacterium]
MQKSKFIAIEGADGAGKSTQIKLLTEYLEHKGVATRFVHFPRLNKGLFGEVIARFLRGEFGESDKVHPQLVALLFAEDRKEFAHTLKGWLSEGCYVFVDRYVYSNIAYQCAKIQDPLEKMALKKWILTLEFEYNQIPQPDLSLYLDVPLNFTRKALEDEREGLDRVYLQGKSDIHEKDIDLQASVKNEYESLIQTENDFQRVVCYNENGSMKSIEQIHSRILSLVGI